MLRWPLPAQFRTITTAFGEILLDAEGNSYPHKGIDVACPNGTPVYAAHDGILTEEYTVPGGLVARVTDIEWMSRYCHLQRYVAGNGAQVRAGDIIGLSDSTGSPITGPHLHWETYIYGVLVDPLGAISMKKTNLHFENAPNEAQRNRIAASNFKIVKSVWPFPAIPGKVCISRHWIGGEGEEWKYVSQGVTGAQALFQRMLPLYQQYPGLVWEVLCMPDTSSLANCHMICAFMVEYARLMHANGFKIAGPATGEGRPEDNPDSTSAAKTAVLGPAYMLMDLITCHSYYCPPQCMPDNAWHTLRYRKIKADLAAAGFNPTTKWVLSEAGIDRGVIGAAGGYKNIPITQQQYLAYIQQHDDELCKDAYILGCTIYTLNPNPSWVSFDYDGWLEDQIYNLAEAGEDDLLTWAETIVIPVNPQAALWQYIRLRGWVPQSQEMSHNGIPFMWAWRSDNTRMLLAWQSGAVAEVYTRPN